MGKNTDVAQILQIGKKNNKYIWNSKYIEKHTNESKIQLFQSIELKIFLEKFLKKYCLNLHKFSIIFSESTLKIFLSYFKTPRVKNFVTKINTNKLKLIRKKFIKKKNYKNFIRIKNEKKNTNILLNKFSKFYVLYNKQFSLLEKKIKKELELLYRVYTFINFFKNRFFLIKFNYICNKLYQQYSDKKITMVLKNNQVNFYRKYLIKKMVTRYTDNLKLKSLLIIKYQNYFKNFLITFFNYKKLTEIFLLNKKLYKKRLKTLRYYKNFTKMNQNKTLTCLRVNNFLKKLSESFQIFTKNKLNNTIILQQINKNIIFNLTYRQFQLVKKLTVQIRRFKNAKFFEEGVNIILLFLTNINNNELLSNFISFQLRLLKRHGIFFKFLLKTFTLLLKYKFSRVKSVKILIKGRINGKPRSKQKLIFINKYMSLMTINSSIKYAYSNDSNPAAGSFGVKLWVNTC